MEKTSHKSLYAITVSKNYSDLLAISIEKNLSFFKKWFIATQEDDTETIELIKKTNDSRIHLILYPLDPRKSKPSHEKSLLTDEKDNKLSTPDYLEPIKGNTRTELQQKEYEKLTKNGVTFDKGGALRQIQKFILPKYNLNSDDLILMLDSDIVIPKNLHKVIDNLNIQTNTIYVCSRKNYIFYSDFENETGVIDKNSLVGAGYFQLHKYDPSKLCKRTYTAGWVDWEFKQQFKYLKHIKNLSVSHLGETDMNWHGKKCETFLYDKDIQSYCKSNDLHYSSDLETNKRTIINSIRINRLNEMSRKLGLPNYLLIGTIHSGVKEIQSALIKNHNISFFQQTWPNLSFFGNNLIKNELWQKHMHFYLTSFPKITNHDWFDTIEFDFSQSESSWITQNRLKIIFTEKIKIWKEFNCPKVILCLKNPIIRAIKHYIYFSDNFPASVNWNWKLPSKSFHKNIMLENEVIDNKSTFILNSEICKMIDWILQDLKIPLKNILFVDTDLNSNEIINKMSNFMQCKVGNNVNIYSGEKFEINNYIDSNTHKILMNHFNEHNVKLKKFTGINFNE